MRRKTFIASAAFFTALMAHAGEMPDFSAFDSDEDGIISEAEFVAQTLSDDRHTEADAKARFMRIDVDKDGAITRPEMTAALEAWRKAKQTSTGQGKTGDLPEGS